VADNEDARAAWHAYHVIGDVLRAPALADAAGDQAFVARLREQMASTSVAVFASEPVHPPQPAANDSMFRWRVAAVFAAVGLVGAVVWRTATLPGAADAGGVLADAQPLPALSPPQAMASHPMPARPAQATDAQLAWQDAPQNARSGPAVMLRDPRLDELLAAHRQHGGVSALHAPAGFLRNAALEDSER
jgi:sigma-E factor negative regulatory protein RseA